MGLCKMEVEPGTSFQRLLSESSSGTRGNAHFKMHNSIISSGGVYIMWNSTLVWVSFMIGVPRLFYIFVDWEA